MKYKSVVLQDMNFETNEGKHGSPKILISY